MTKRETAALAALVISAASLLPAQPPAVSVKKFEVASVKVSPPFSGVPRAAAMRGGPGTSDPTRVLFENYSMMDLLRTAFDVRFDQISGPDWLRVFGPSAELYDNSATLPAAMSREAFHSMLRNLLIERFSLATHVGRKESRAYRLVPGAGSPRLRQSVENETGSDDTATQRAPSNTRATIGTDGYPALPPGILGASTSRIAGVFPTPVP